MTDYIREIQRQLISVYKFKENPEKPGVPTNVPDGDYPMTINGKIDHVKIARNVISCCNFKPSRKGHKPMTLAKCPKCAGTGKAPVSETLQAMFDDVVAFPGCSAPQHAKWHRNVGVTAFNQRLEDLRALGLVRRERRGREWLYFPTQGKR